jgi:hypothetical protein
MTLWRFQGLVDAVGEVSVTELVEGEDGRTGADR